VDLTYWPGGATNAIKDNGASTNIAQYEYLGSRILKRVMQNGVNLDLTDGGISRYTPSGQPSRWASVNTSGQTVVGYDSLYDHAGNPTTAISLHDAVDSQRYAYDSDSRLTAFIRGQIPLNGMDYCSDPEAQPYAGMTQAQQWTLDGVGNWDQVRTKANDSTATENRQDGTFNEYSVVGSVSPNYDANGNLTNDGAHQYVWDAFNRLREAKTSGGVTIANYYYDASNRRVRKDLASGPDTDFFYNGWRVLEERPSAGTAQNPTRQFVYGNYLDEPLVMDVNGNSNGTCTDTTGDTRTFYAQNTIYSTVALTNAAGQVVEAYEYDPYGKHVTISDGNDADAIVNFNSNDTRTALGASQTAIGNPYFFTGQRFDPETGLHYFKNRYYSTVLGRFVSRDPRSNGIHHYCYVEARVMIATDELGEVWNFQPHNLGTRPVTTTYDPETGEPSTIAGQAWIDYFKVKPQIKRKWGIFGKCKLSCEGDASASFWWATEKDWTNPYDSRKRNTYDHEMNHIHQYEYYWRALEEKISTYYGEMCCPKAKCYARLFELYNLYFEHAAYHSAYESDKNKAKTDEAMQNMMNVMSQIVQLKLECEQ